MVNVLGGLRLLLHCGILLRLNRWMVPSILVDEGKFPLINDFIAAKVRVRYKIRYIAKVI